MNQAIRRPVKLVTLGFAVTSLAVPASRATSQELRVTAAVGKEVFFEGEPIYGLFELSNNGPDTAWAAIFGFGPDRLAVSLRRVDGTALPATRLWVEYAIPPGWRGAPVAPDERKYLMMVLQNILGDPVQPSWTLFPNHIPPGIYTLSATFNSAVAGPSGAESTLDAEPVRIEVKQRTPEEERSFRDIEKTLGEGWNRATRAGYFPRLMALIRSRLAADSLDPFAAFLVNDAVMTGHAWGLRLASSDASQLTRARLGVARAQRSRPSGAVAALALLREPIPPSDLAAQLGPSLAGEVARWRERVPRTPSMQPGRRND